MKLKPIFWPIVLLLGLGTFACQDDEPLLAPEEESLRNELVQLMEQWYFWHDKLPQEVDIFAYGSAQEMLQALRHQPFDRWSYMVEKEVFDQYFEQGELIGWGFGLKFDQEDNLRISYVTPGSPADGAGVTRGMKVTAINGKPLASINDVEAEFGADAIGVTVPFTFERTDGTTLNTPLTKEVINIKPVLHRSIIEHGNQKTGYVVFNNFIAAGEQPLVETFQHFQSEGVDDVVLDLRYNGGGILSLAEKLGGMIAGSNVSGKLMVQIEHNTLRSSENNDFNFAEPSISLNLNRLVVITTGSSASASEAIINGLKPYIDVKTVGQDSYGKPVGSYSFAVGDYAVLPISFRLINADGEADYFEGIPVDGPAPDDLTKDFGNPEEACLREALQYLETGSFTLSGGRIGYRKNQENPRLQPSPFRREVGVY